MAINLPKPSFKKKPKSEAAQPMPAPDAPQQDVQAPDPSKLSGIKAKLGRGKPSAKIGEKIEKTKSPKSKLPALKKRSCFVLMLGDEGGILTYIDKGNVARRLFAPSPEKQHVAPLHELMASHPKAPVYVMCDMMDQSYVRHSLPPVSALSVKKLVDRRIERDFAPEDITGSIALGREKTGRKEWNFMLIALANTAILQKWLDELMELPNLFKGIYLQPVEAVTFAEQLAKAATPKSEAQEAAQWRMLLVHDKVGGFRQVVMQDNKLVFTRLTQFVPEAPTEVTAGNIEQEMQNTLEYLRRLGYDEKHGMELYIIVSQDIRDLLDVKAMRASLVKCYTPFEAGQLLGLPQAALSGDRFADVVYSTNFALRQSAKLPLMTAYANKLNQLRMGKLGATAFGALAAVYLLYTGVNNFSQKQEYSQKQEQLQRQIPTAQTELDRAKRRFDALSEGQTQVLQVAQLYRGVGGDGIDPLAFVQQLARVKGGNIAVREIDWNELQEEQTDRRGRVTGTVAKSEYKLELEFLNLENDKRVLANNIAAFSEQLAANFEAFEHQFVGLPEGDAPQEKKLTIDLNAEEKREEYELNAGDEIVTVIMTRTHEGGR